MRTGRMQAFRDGGAHLYMMGPGGAAQPGPGFDAVSWFRRHDVAAVAGDTYIFEVFPGPEPADMLAVHCLTVVEMGAAAGEPDLGWHRSVPKRGDTSSSSLPILSHLWAAVVRRSVLLRFSDRTRPTRFRGRKGIP